MVMRSDHTAFGTFECTSWMYILLFEWVEGNTEDGCGPAKKPPLARLDYCMHKHRKKPYRALPTK